MRLLTALTLCKYAVVVGAIVSSVPQASAQQATFTTSCPNVDFAVNDGGFWVKASQIPPGGSSPGLYASSSISGSNFHLTAQGAGYSDAGIVLFFKGGLTLGNLQSVSVAATGSPLAMNLWLDTGGDGTFFAFNSNGLLTALNGDSYGGHNGTYHDTTSSFYMLGGDGAGNTYTLAQLQAGADPGIDGNTPVSLWIGITNGGGSTLVADISSVTVSASTPVAGGCGTFVSGTISSNTTWSVANSPYIVTGNIGVNSGVTLTIDAGVIVEFNSSRQMDVSGTLSANGTSGNPITFTSSSATPTPGSWNCLTLHSGSSASQLAYTTISYGGACYAELTLEATSVSLNHVTVSNSSSEGLRVGLYATGAAPTITGCTLASNASYGINVLAHNTATISGCTFASNGNYAIGSDVNTSLLDLSNLTATGNGSGGTKNSIGYRGGGITGSEHWLNGSLWREVTGSTTVNSGATLTIDPGTMIKFAPNTWLTVNGTINAVGTSGNAILFTSNAASPSAGSWNGIHFSNAPSGNQIAYATVIYAGSNSSAAVLIEGSVATLDHLTVSNSSVDGIRLNYSGSNTTITNSTLSSNSGYGINVTSGNAATISGSTFTSNGNYAIGADANTSLLDLSNLTATGNGTGGTKNSIAYRGGSISGSEHWLNGSLWREVTGGTTVNTGATLTIDPGTTVKFANVALNVYGTLNAIGTAAAPILFTSNAATPASGSWQCIHYFAGSSPSQMAYATITYSGGYYAGLVFDAGTASFDHVSVTNSNGAVRVWNAAHPTFRHGAFVNTGTGITNSGTEQVDAILCYWGASDGPSGVGHGSGLSVSTNVSFDPWLTAAPSTPEYVSGATVHSRTFNPALALPTISPNFALAGNWTLNILNSGGTVLRTYTGSGQSANVTWDAQDSNGVLQSAGNYTFTIDDTATTGEIATTARGVLLLTNASYQPTIAITSVSSGQTLSNVYQNGNSNVSIAGSAADPNMHNWTLDYGAGSAPASWSVLATGTTNVQNAQFLLWSTLPITNGAYTLRLRYWDTYGNYSVVSFPISVGNFQLAQNGYQVSQSGGSVAYTSTIPFQVTETLVLKNGAGVVARTLVNTSRTAGTYSDTWDGRSDNGGYLPDGGYLSAATVTDGVNTMTWDLSNQYFSGSVTYYALTFSSFDPFNNQPLTFTYNALGPTRNFVAANPNLGHVPATCDPPNFCIVNGLYEPAGPHTVSWAGVDQTGAIFRAQEIGAAADPTFFQQNAVVVFGTKPSLTNVHVTPPVFAPSFGAQTVSFTLSTFQSQTANVTVTFVNQSSLSVLRTIQLSNQAPGSINVLWDGKADNGMYAAPGFYTVTVTATDGIGNQVMGQILSTIQD